MLSDEVVASDRAVEDVVGDIDGVTIDVNEVVVGIVVISGWLDVCVVDEASGVLAVGADDLLLLPSSEISAFNRAEQPAFQPQAALEIFSQVIRHEQLHSV